MLHNQPFLFRLPRLHAVHSCGQSAQTSHVAWSVCVCVRHTGELCKNGRTDRDAIWQAYPCEPKKPYIRQRSRYSHRIGHFWGDMCQPIVTYLCNSVLQTVRLPSLQNMPAQRICQTNAFVITSGDKTVMWPFAFYPPYDGKMSTSQRAVMLCRWEGNLQAWRKIMAPPGGWLKSPVGWLPIRWMILAISDMHITINFCINFRRIFTSILCRVPSVHWHS